MNGGMFEECTQRSAYAKQACHSSNHQRREQRVSPELEEVAIAADLGHAKNLSLNLRDDYFNRIGRRNEQSFVRGSNEIWRRQRTTIDLAVRGEWKPVQKDYRRWNHRLRQDAARSDEGRVAIAIIFEVPLTYATRRWISRCPLSDDDDCRRYAGLLQQYRLNFSGLDPLAIRN